MEGRFVFSSDTTMLYRRLEMRLPTDGYTDLSVPEGFFVAKEVNPGLLSIPYSARRRLPRTAKKAKVAKGTPRRKAMPAL